MSDIVYYVAVVAGTALLVVPLVIVHRISTLYLEYNKRKGSVAHIPRFPQTMGVLEFFSLNTEKFMQQITDPKTGQFHDIINMGPGLGGKPLLLVLNTDMVKQILSGSADTDFPKPLETYGDVSEALVGDGLVTSHGEKWKFHRQLLTPLFHMKTLKEMQQMMVLYTNDLLATLEQSSGEWLPGLETFGAYTLSQIIMLAFGGLIDVNRLVAKQQEQGKQFGQYIKMRNLFGNIYKYLPVPSTLKLFSLKAQIAEQAKSVIRQVRSELERKQKNGELDENNALHTDLLRTMVEARHPKTGEPVSEQEIIDEATTLLFAGFDTTAVTLSWALYRLSMDSRVQDKLAAEIKTVLGDRDPTLDDLSKLVYMRQVIKETLRCHSPAPAVARYAAKDTYLGPQKVFVPAGTEMHIGIQYIQYDERNYKNATEFYPERWTDTEDSGERNPYAFLPFSAGSRNCIGKAFANQELGVALSMLMRKFRVEYDPTRPVRNEMSPVPSPMNLFVKFTPR